MALHILKHFNDELFILYVAYSYNRIRKTINREHHFMSKLKTFWKNNRQLVVFIVLMSVFRSAVADWYTVPTGSMQPTIKEGDRIVAVSYTHLTLPTIYSV